MWLVIFPEGTRYNVQNTAAIEKSQKFAAEKGTNEFTILKILIDKVISELHYWWFVCSFAQECQYYPMFSPQEQRLLKLVFGLKLPLLIKALEIEHILLSLLWKF